ncbi:ADP-ribosylation/Crystallin J1 [Archaeoglobus veneficus SNP6]|uniref:ADP-ribosylation/Crystallin J1 n=2 Tax=Archaeoglobus veneficus TaxID=58290 RepID=F2KS40_ARCVS|nr:ADP-ribosylation/Crystallin J1 [Archaeoglobus veneficus SNP6]
MVDRFRGAIAGFAVGDAIGMPYEGLPKEDIEIESSEVEPVEWTDDTEQMLILAESLLSTTYFDPEDFAFRLCKITSPKIGPTTAEALRKLRSGVPWREAGVDSNTCGAAMRVMPLGIVYSFSLDLVESYAVMQAMVTHKGKAAIAGSVAVAIAFACICMDYSDDEILDEVCARCRQYDDLMAEKIEMARDSSIEELGTTILATDVVPSALHCYLNSESYEECVLMAVRAGGDTDTIAAIAGGLKGAKLGHSAIPERWGTFAEELLHIADELYRLYVRIST